MKTKNAKIDQATAQAILNLRTFGLTNRQAADNFGPEVSPRMVGYIWRRETWRQLKEPDANTHHDARTMRDERVVTDTRGIAR